jgi:uncharacterized protein YkwD
MIHKKLLWLLAIGCLLVIALPTITHKSAKTTSNYPPVPTIASSDVYTLVNQQRTTNGLQPLTDNPLLDKSAAEKCQDMATNKYIGHVSPTGVTWNSFIHNDYVTQLPPNTAVTLGENLSENYYTAPAAVAGWMGSPEHRANILNSNFTQVGYAVCRADNDINVIVQHFAS